MTKHPEVPEWEKEFDSQFTYETFCACGGEYDTEKYRTAVKSFISRVRNQTLEVVASEIEKKLMYKPLLPGTREELKRLFTTIRFLKQ